MSKEEFFEQLRNELGFLPENKVEAAIKRYETYFSCSDNIENTIESIGGVQGAARTFLRKTPHDRGPSVSRTAVSDMGGGDMRYSAYPDSGAFSICFHNHRRRDSGFCYRRCNSGDNRKHSGMAWRSGYDTERFSGRGNNRRQAYADRLRLYAVRAWDYLYGSYVYVLYKGSS